MVSMMNTSKEVVGPINIGNPAEHSMLELAEIILKLTGSKSKLVFKSLPSDDPKQRKPDITQAKDKLNWAPKVSVYDGLKETIAYFKKVMGT
jgi:UDP-glucuronate decarboxylase